MCRLGVISQERLKIEVKLLLSARKSYYASSIGTTTDDLEWPFHTIINIIRIAIFLFLDFLASSKLLARLSLSQNRVVAIYRLENLYCESCPHL